MDLVDELDVVTPDSLGQFVHRWYGLPDRPPGNQSLPHGLPAPLVNWYRVAQRRSIPLSRDHTLRPAERLRLDEPMVAFWDGEVDAYAYASGPQDPWVFERGEGGAWLPTGVPLSRFLVYVAVYEAVYAPLHGLVRLSMPAGEMAGVTRRLRELADPLWRWPDPALRYYADDDLLAHAGITEDRTGRVVLAARHRDALGRFDGLGIAWDWDSRTVT